MKRAIVIVVLGIVLGLGSAVGALWYGGIAGGLRVGPWGTPLDAGGVNRNIYTRAVVAVRATLGLSRKETIYFGAMTDSAGAKLRGECTYTVHGPDLPARWWSITLYANDQYLIANPANRYSYASANIARGEKGDFSITVGPTAAPGNYLDTARAPHLELLTRLYQPLADAAANPAGIKLPAIDLVGCAP